MGVSLLKMDPGDSSVHSGKNLSSGGENQSANHWAVRTIVKKGEDRFLVCEDLRALFLDDTKELLVSLLVKTKQKNLKIIWTGMQMAMQLLQHFFKELATKVV